MEEKIFVYVNDKKVKIYAGLKVKHALISYDESLYAAAEKGDIAVEDENGFKVGLEGALHPRVRLYIKGAYLHSNRGKK